MQNLIGMNTVEIATALNSTKKLVAKQVATAVYKNGCRGFDKMTNLSLGAREEYASRFAIQYPEVKTDLLSIDGTRKWLFKLAESDIETVYIPDANSNSSNDAVGTLCISSQVGCSLNCSFCFTGTQKFSRNLLPSEIVGQVMYAMNEYGDFPQIINRKRAVNNIVLMGQGEPLYNYKNVKSALDVIINELNYPPWRITLSTSGLCPLIPQIAKDIKCSLAISLHATTNELRDELVPINKMYPIEELIKSCEKFLEYMPNNKHRRITFEYVMLKGVNDSIQDAARLVRLVEHLPCHVNLIPWNPWDGAKYKSSDRSSINAFRNKISEHDIVCTIRESRGLDIMAACGQLKSSSDSKKHYTPTKSENPLNTY